VSYYAGVPQEVWIPIESLMGITIVILFGKEQAVTWARERALAESRQREKDQQKRQVSLEDRG
jgi:hypothetical protein